MARGVGADPVVPAPERDHLRGEVRGPVVVPVVRDHPVDPDAVGGEERPRPAEEPDRGHRFLVVEGFGAVAGGLGSASSNTVFADSSAGIADGARTGLANLMTGVLFLAAMFLTPLYEIVPIEAASPVLVIVGVMMAAQLTEIRWTKMEIAIPAFLTIVTMPFTYSIANGIGVGFISFALMSTFAGKAKDVHWIMWLLAGLFVIFFGMDPISNAIG